MSGFGRSLIYLGLVLVAIGLLFSFSGKIPGSGIFRETFTFTAGASASIFL